MANSVSTAATPTGVTDLQKSNARRATTAAFLGSVLEYYDIFIYGSAAALVLPKLFFPTSDAAVALTASFSTFALAYLIRPIGAILWGHLGDRFGRKRILVLTLILMGAGTVGIGLLPSYAQIGVIAPLGLVLLRIVQGLSAGGESAGSSTLTIEHAPENRRGFLTSFTMAGCMVGSVLASLVFIPVAALPIDQLDSWGWRIPFLLSVVLLIVGFVVRRTVRETPVFEDELKEKKVERVPFFTLFRFQWRSVIVVFFGTMFAAIQILFLVFGLSFATTAKNPVPAATVLTIQVVATAVCAVLTPVWALLSDRVGRKRIWIASSIVTAVLIFIYFGVSTTGNVPLIFLIGILMFGVAYAAMNGLWPAFFAEQFPAAVRFSGLAISVQLGLILAGFAPTIGVALAGAAGNWIPVGLFGAAAALVAGIAPMFGRETFRTKTADLGKP